MQIFISQRTDFGSFRWAKYYFAKYKKPLNYTYLETVFSTVARRYCVDRKKKRGKQLLRHKRTSEQTNNTPKQERKNIRIYTILQKIEQIRIFRKPFFFTFYGITSNFPIMRRSYVALILMATGMTWYKIIMAYFTIVPRARVRYEMMAINSSYQEAYSPIVSCSYLTSASGINVLLKAPPKYSKLNKIKNDQKIAHHICRAW